MKTLFTVIFILALAAITDAKDIFKEKDMKDLRVVAIQDGKAVVQDKGGARKDVGIEDHIGKENGRIIEMEKTYITVETQKGRTRLPVAHGFERR